MSSSIDRRLFFGTALAAAAAFAGGRFALAQAAKMAFPRWVETFRARARARGVSDATYTRVMANVKPDMAVFALEREQPEFHEELWQYLNRRRSYWEQELVNALVIVERGWSSPEEMIGSWAGAMGHTQWMPEVWLHMGIDYDHDGRISPFGKPDDAIAGTARYLAQRGHYRRGEAWGYEVRLPGGLSAAAAERMGNRGIAQWQKSGVVPADGTPFPRPGERAKAWVPVPGGPAFLIAQNFFAIRSYNPSNNYALAIAHLADRIRGKGEFVQKFPGGERTPTLEELQEIQRRLTALGFDTGGTDGRVGRDTMVAVQAFQRKTGLQPADGYAGLKVLARLRQGM